MLRKLFAVVAAVALLAPAGAGLCAAQAVPCTMSSEHACCETPRMAACCGASHVPGHQAETPASPAPVTSAVALAPAFGISAPVQPASAADVCVVEPPPLDVGERLSLLAILLV